MQLSEFDFPFDASLIASEPLLPRDQARLLVLSPRQQSMTHERIADLPNLLSAGDLLVVNDTRVRPARVTGRKPSGGTVDVLFVKAVAERDWEVLMKGKWRVGQVIDVGKESRLTVLGREGGRTVVRIESTLPVMEWFDANGMMPLPPYIKRSPIEADREWYQTVFAKEQGAIAAPTAGLHFTPGLLSRLAERRIEVAKVTLHVGVGTFKPVTAEHIEDHKMEAEWVDVGPDTVEAIDRTKQRNGKVVAVGTTVVRALESAASGANRVRNYRGETALFIAPGYRFQVVDAMLTNFHLPQTTLLMLVAAFAGAGFLRKAYDEAVQKRYRFYSYGDAMLIIDREAPLVGG
jgi:S-adenosylmethionine:tRNA ribosyltransferase-isomerase